ncbi:MAG: DUF721 domain-containing protein [Xenococcus sp. (in: cyanobacteria)]
MRSLDKILSKLTQQPEWQEYNQYQQLATCWRNIVNRKISQNTRPIYFSRGIFGIATSSAVWAQELTLQRYSLLKKVNRQLNFEVQDIRFTPARWTDIMTQENQTNSVKNLNNKENIAAIRPKQVESATEIATPKTAHESLQNWLEQVKMRSQNLPLCPQCNSPTPQKELERWHFCCHCMAQQKHLEYRPATFLNINSQKQ